MTCCAVAMVAAGFAGIAAVAAAAGALGAATGLASGDDRLVRRRAGGT
jgi:hypothetical protein